MNIAKYRVALEYFLVAVLWFRAVAAQAQMVDLGVVQALGAPTATIGSNLTISVTVTNTGGQTATGVFLTNRLPAGTALVSAHVSEGTCTNSGSNVICNFGALPAGSSASLALNLLPTIAGWITNGAVVVADQTNASSSIAIFVGIQTEPNTNWQIAIPSLALAYGSNSDQLYISVPASAGVFGNSLIPVDPNTGAFGQPILSGTYPQGLAVSADSQFLYVGTYSNRVFQRLDLPTATPSLTFPLDPVATNTTLKDMQVEPNDAHALVVLRTPDCFNVQVALYEDGVALTNEAATHSDLYGESLALPDNIPMAFVQNDGVAGLSSYSINSNGVTFINSDTTLNPLLTTITLQWADGLLYTSLGRVIDPISHVIVGQIPDITAASVVTFDKAANLLFYLTPNETTNVIRAIDPNTWTTLGTVNVTGAAGSPANLVRWGADGLAFRTTAGQLFIVRSSIVPSGATANLAIGCVGTPTVVGLNNNFSFTTTVTNLGPDIASNVIIFDRLPQSGLGVSAVSSAGTSEIFNGLVQCNVGTLAPGGTAMLQVTLRTALAGAMVNVASVLSGAIDPNFTNNVAQCVVQAALNLGPDSTGQITMSVHDIAYNSSSGQLYVSGNPSQIAVLDPATGLTNSAWALPSPGGILRLSSDNTLLYCVLNQGSDVGQLATATGQLNFDLPIGFTVNDVAPVPGAPSTFAIGSANVIEVYDQTTARPVYTDDSAGARNLAFGATSNQFYALGHALSGGTRYRVLSLTSNGTAEISYNESVPFSLGNLTFANGVFYAATGEVIDPQTGNTLGKFAGPSSGSLVAPDIANDRVFFLNKSNSIWQLQAYEPATLGLLGSVVTSNILGTPTRLLRCGADGLAFCTTSNQLFLLRTSLVPTGYPADLAIVQAVSPAVGLAGSNLTFTITVTNAGPNTASNVFVFDQFPTNVTVVTNTRSQGTAVLAGSLLTCSLGTISVGGSATIQLELMTRLGGSVANIVDATSYQPDPQLSNNSSECVAQVGLNLPSGGSGVIQASLANIVYDPISGLIYAACTNVPGYYTNSIITIDPATGLFGGPILTAPQLLDVAVSDDGSHVYTLANGGHQLLGLNLSNGVMETQVTLSTSNEGNWGSMIKAIPAQPCSVAVVVQNPTILLGNPTVTVYDGSVQRPNTTSARLIEFYSSDHMMGFDSRMVPSQSYRIALTAQGAVHEATAGNLVDGAMAASGGLIYTTAGSVINPQTMAKLLSFSVGGPVAPDTTVNRVAFLTGSGSTQTLRVFDTTAQNDWGSVNVSNIIGSVGRLIRCGSDRYAFYTTSGQLFIVRSPAIPSVPSAPAVLSIVNRPVPQTLSPVLQITAPSGYKYSLESSTNLLNWNVVTNYNATNVQILILDTNNAGLNACFYRVVNQ